MANQDLPPSNYLFVIENLITMDEHIVIDTDNGDSDHNSVVGDDNI